MNIAPRARTRAPTPPTVAPRQRTRKVQPVARRKAPWDVPIIGGPKERFSNGNPIHTKGQPIKTWPYKTGDVLIGWSLREYIHLKAKQRVFHDGTDIAYVKTHVWQFRDGAMRYMGAFQGQDVATNRVTTAYTRRTSEQLVSPRARNRAIRNDTAIDKGCT